MSANSSLSAIYPDNFSAGCSTNTSGIYVVSVEVGVGGIVARLNASFSVVAAAASVESPGGGVINVSISNGSFANVTVEDAPQNITQVLQSAGLISSNEVAIFPHGIISFEVVAGPNVSVVSVNISYPSLPPLQPGQRYVYFKLLVNGSWVRVEEGGGVNQFSIVGNTVVLRIEDNGFLDSNSTLGVVSDPGGIAIVTVGVGGGVIAADNISAIATSRDGAPFNGNVWLNSTVVVNITFRDFVNTTTFPTVNLGLRIMTPDRSAVRFVCTINATPAVSGAFVSIYSTTIFINNTMLGFHNATPPGPASLADFRNASCPGTVFVAPALNMSSGDIIQIYVTAINGTHVVFKELIFRHTPAAREGVEGVPDTVPSEANIDDVPLTGIFNVTAPDLNMLWNLRDNTTIYIVFGNDSLGYYLTNSFTLIEVGRNAGKFWNDSIKTLGVLVNSTGVNATGRFFAMDKILKEGRYNISILVPKTNSTPPIDLAPGGVNAQQITDFGAPAIKDNFDVINISIVVAPPSPVSMFVDRGFIPATIDYNISINITIVDPFVINASSQVVFGQTLNITIYNAMGGVFKRNEELSATTPIVISRLPSVSVVILINGSAAFQPPYQVQNGFLRVEYLSPSGVKESRDIPIRVVDVSIGVNGTSSVNVTYGDYINITVVSPAANTNTTAFDTLVVRVSGANVGFVVLNETAPNSGVFTKLLRVGVGGDIYADPGSTIVFRYVYNASILTPLGAAGWVSKTVTASATIQVRGGFILSPVDGSRMSPVGRFNVTIVDPSRNGNISGVDSISYSIRLWNGSILTRTAIETGVNTGVFSDAFDKGLLGSPEDLLRGQKVEVIYVTLSGSMEPAILVSTVWFVSFDGIITLDKPYYMPGDVMAINVTDPDAAGRGFLSVRVSSSSDPIGVSVTLYELFLQPGVFIGYVTVSDNPVDFGRPGYIYARLGDRIMVRYTDQLPADYSVSGMPKDMAVSVNVGLILDKPISLQVSMVYADGTPVSRPAAGRLVLFLVSATNNNSVGVNATIVFKVLNANNTPLSLQAIGVSIPGGETIGLRFSYTFPAPGNYSVSVVAVKSLADQKQLSDEVVLGVSVVGGSRALEIGGASMLPGVAAGSSTPSVSPLQVGVEPVGVLDDILLKLDRVAGDLRGGVSGLNSSIAGVMSSVSDLRTRLAVLEDLRAAMAGIRADLGGVRTDIGGLLTGQRDLSGRFDALSSRLDSVSSDLRGLVGLVRDGLSSSIAGFGSRLDTLGRDLGVRVDSVSAGVGGLMAPIAIAIVLALLAFIFTLLTLLQVRRIMTTK